MLVFYGFLKNPRTLVGGPAWRREIRILQLVKFTFVLSSCLTDAVNVGLRYGGREDLDHDEGVHLGLWMGGVRGVGIQKV